MSTPELPTTTLFTEGITPQRIARVAKILPTLLNRIGVAIQSNEISPHVNGGESLNHMGWLINRTIVQRPVYWAGMIVDLASTGHTLFVPERGVLTVCAVDQKGELTDTTLQAEQLETYDILAARGIAYDPRIPERARQFNSTVIGGLVTDFVQTYDISSEARQFATDPPHQ